MERPPQAGGYADWPITKPPNWHHLVAWDTLFNNLSSGLFLAAALGELARPETFTRLATVAYPVAFVVLVADLICLVLDLGDPWRFHHMMRVFKPTSPMSLGTWCLNAFGPPVTALAALCLFPVGGALGEWLRWLIILVGLPAAFATAAYKGVLFSTTAQPGWRDARWLGGYLTSSALTLGCATLLALALLTGEDRAAGVLRTALPFLLLLNLLILCLLIGPVRGTLALAHSRSRLVGLTALVVGVGLLLPLALAAIGGTPALFGAALGVLAGAAAARFEIVHLPHAFRHPL